MSEESESDKTEDPTPHRKKKAREEGQVPRSRELTTLAMLLVGWGLSSAQVAIWRRSLNLFCTTG